MTAIIDAESILVIDVGSVTTRAILFEVADDRYRFIAMGTANTTAIAPFKNIGEGVRLALDDLQRVTGRVLIDSRQQLIIPAASDGTGVDRFAATISAGAPLKVAVVGLLEDVSGESARRLVQTTYSDLIYTFSLTDHRKADARLNMLVRSRPDLIVVAGGTDGGLRNR
ncbi:MAG: glutamate mutase L [Anaerolineales bacterium]|nr:glutamate mutase L [Anaerolineales bacterium]